MSQLEEEEDDAEYFRQAVGEEPDEGGQCLYWPHLRSYLLLLRNLTTISLPTDLFPTVAKRRRQGGPVGKKRPGKEQRPGNKGRGQSGNWQALKPHGRSQRVKTKLGPRARSRDLGPPSRKGP